MPRRAADAHETRGPGRRKLTLTANTVCLIALYGKFGFVLDGPNIKTTRALESAAKAKAEFEGAKPEDKARLQAAYNDTKFAQIDALMALSPEGRGQLQEQYRPLVDYMGPVL